MAGNIIIIDAGELLFINSLETLLHKSHKSIYKEYSRFYDSSIDEVTESIHNIGNQQSYITDNPIYFNEIKTSTPLKTLKRKVEIKKDSIEMTNLLIKNDNLDINTIFVSGNFTLSKFKAGKGLNEKIKE